MQSRHWPSLFWHLYDYYLRPGGKYFGAKKACEPLHPLYSYDDRSVWVVNSSYQDVPKLRLTTRVYNLDFTEKYSEQTILDAAADSSRSIFTLPDIDDLTSTYFLQLTIDNARGKRLSTNFYWLSKKSETLDWSKVTYDTTEALAKAQYGDFLGLNSLPRVHLKHFARTEHSSGEMLTHVLVENADKSLAMFVHLAVKRSSDGKEILPVLWQDNYFSLLPGETREITAEYPQSDLHNSKPMVSVDGWNVVQDENKTQRRHKLN